MRRPTRLISAAVLVALSTAMAGCSSSSFEASDLLDWMDTKKKLPGDRKPVFPEGVPGVQQGVPRELYRGYVDPYATPSAQDVPGAAPRGQVNVGAVQSGGEPAAEPAPKRPRKQAAKRRATAPVNEAPVEQAAPEPAPAAASPSAFPAPLPSGSFQR